MGNFLTLPILINTLLSGQLVSRWFPCSDPLLVLHIYLVWFFAFCLCLKGNWFQSGLSAVFVCLFLVFLLLLFSVELVSMWFPCSVCLFTCFCYCFFFFFCWELVSRWFPRSDPSLLLKQTVSCKTKTKGFAYQLPYKYKYSLKNRYQLLIIWNKLVSKQSPWREILPH